MNEDILEKVQQIHETDQQVVLAIAGAGHSIINWLVSVPGASRTLLEAIVPYSRKSMTDFLSFEPEKSVSKETAWAMALVSYKKAKKQTKFPIGIGCTATIRTIEPKKGEHRAIIVVWTPEKTITYSIVLEKNKRTREEEELVVGYLILISLCQAMNINTFGLNIELLPGDVIEKDEIKTPKIMVEKE